MHRKNFPGRKRARQQDALERAQQALMRHMIAAENHPLSQDRERKCTVVQRDVNALQAKLARAV
jgi:hypothetical protein